MALIIKKTNDTSLQRRNTLLLGHAGSGKTTQAKHYQQRYGKGLILSGEAGLLTLSDQDIDYVPIQTFNGKHNPEAGFYSFAGICKEIHSADFKSLGYNWMMLDSLTELSDLAHAEAEAEASKNGKMDGFKVWGDYGKMMLGALKFFRDLPFEVIVTCLVKEDSNEDGQVVYLPLVKGQAIQRQIPGIFDNVFALVKKEQRLPDNKVEIHRYVVTDEVRGYACKYRSPNQTLDPVEKCTDITKLFDKMDAVKKE